MSASRRLLTRKPSASSADVDQKYARQSGGKGQYGHVKIIVEPNEPGKGYEFINKIVGGAIPKEYIPSRSTRVSRVRCRPVCLAGYPVVDVKVTLYDGSYHEVDSSEMAFKIAGSMAFKEAMKKADPVLMEPIMKVDVMVPEDYMGDVIGDLNARRGQIQGMEPRGGVQADFRCRSAVRDVRLCDRRCVRARRVVASTPCSPAITRKFPRAFQEKIMDTRNERLMLKTDLHFSCDLQYE